VQEGSCVLYIANPHLSSAAVSAFGGVISMEMVVGNELGAALGKRVRGPMRTALPLRCRERAFKSSCMMTGLCLTQVYLPSPTPLTKIAASSVLIFKSVCRKFFRPVSRITESISCAVRSYADRSRQLSSVPTIEVSCRCLM
jgi:hypothetical protein